MIRYIYILLAIFFFGGNALANTPTKLSLENEFISVFVNNNDLDKGRFSIETTGGDLSRDNDNKEPLIYGRPIPWTSYTTLQIDGKSHVFGGKTKKRAGKTAVYGRVTVQDKHEGRLRTVTQFKDIDVTQTLQFFRNPLSRVHDMVLVKYEIVNKGTRTRRVGARIMMDTMLGNNDGAPFRIGAHAFQSEQEFKGSKLLSYWQTFDSLNNPKVIAQGMTSHSEAGIKAPDRMLISNWGLLADSPWNFDYKEGRAFVRAGELEQDTALALYFKEEELKPNQTRVVQTLYGLGGVSLAPGALSLGLAAPAEISVSSKEETLLVAYVMNAGGYTSRNTVLNVTLPPGLKVVDGQKRVRVGELGPGESKQVAIKVIPTTGIRSGNKQFRLSASSQNLEPNQLVRKVQLLGPPKLDVAIMAPKEVVPGPVSYMDVKVAIQNPTERNVRALTVKLDLEPGLVVPDFELEEKSIEVLAPGEKQFLHWKVRVLEQGASKRRFKVAYHAPILPTKIKGYSVKVLPIPSSLYLTTSADNVQKDRYFFLDLQAIVPKAFRTGRVNIRYPKEKVRLLRTSVNPKFQDQRYFDKLQHKDGLESIDNWDYRWGAFSGSLCKFHFKALKEGPVTFELQNDGVTILRKIVQINPRKGDLK